MLFGLDSAAEQLPQMRTASERDRKKEEEKHASRPSQVSGSHGKDTATVPPAFNICGLSFVIHWRIQGGQTKKSGKYPNKWIRINESECGNDCSEVRRHHRSRSVSDLLALAWIDARGSESNMSSFTFPTPAKPTFMGSRQSLPNKLTTKKAKRFSER